MYYKIFQSYNQLRIYIFFMKKNVIQKKEIEVQLKSEE